MILLKKNQENMIRVQRPLRKFFLSATSTSLMAMTGRLIKEKIDQRTFPSNTIMRLKKFVF